MYRKLALSLIALLLLEGLEMSFGEEWSGCRCTCDPHPSPSSSLLSASSFGNLMRGKEGPRGQKGEPGEGCQDELATLTASTLPALVKRIEALETQSSELEKLKKLVKIKSCQDVQEYGLASGVYRISLDGKNTEVFCTDDGFTVIQRRYDGSTDFNQNHQAYVDGFGEKRKEYWLGLEWMHVLTSAGTWKLRVELESFDDKTKYAEYHDFKIGEGPEYRLQLGSYSGTAGDKFSYNEGSAFSTPEVDNHNNCASDRSGAWWYRSCTYVNLNAFNYGRGVQNDKYDIAKKKMYWYRFNNYSHDGLKSSVMKIFKTA